MSRFRRFKSQIQFYQTGEDRSLLVALLLISLLGILSIASSSTVLGFFNPFGLCIVIGGTFAAALIQYSQADLQYALESAKRALFDLSATPLERMDYLKQLAQAVKRNGLIVLDREADMVRDPFLRFALEVAADGQPVEEIRRLLELEIQASRDRAERAADVFETMAIYSPAMGLIGTLLGLVEMLGNLQDAATVGPAMSVALLTTLYGAIIANFICAPMAGKLRNIVAEQATLKRLTLEGVACLRREESPVILEQKLQSFTALAG